MKSRNDALPKSDLTNSDLNNGNHSTDYGAALESYYEDLVLNQRAGRISAQTHNTLDNFLNELRELVAEVNPVKMAKAA